MTTTPNQRRSTPRDMESTQEESRLPSPDRPARTRANGLTAVLVRLHFYAGLLIGPFLLIATLSGGLYAVAPTLEQLLYRSYLHAETTGPALPVAEQIRAAQQVHPDLTVTAVRPASEPGETTRVLFDDPTLGESLRRAVFIDPAAAQPQGDLAVYGSSSALPARTWISQLHRNLHLGEPGRIYSELAASWLWVIALGGLWLWVSRYRRMTARTSTGARLFTINRESTGRSRTLGWHGAVGLWIVAGLIFLSATGLTWSTYVGANITAVRAALSWTTPTVATALTDSGPVTDVAEDHDHSGHNFAAAQEDSDTAAARIDEVDRVLQSAATPVSAARSKSTFLTSRTSRSLSPKPANPGSCRTTPSPSTVPPARSPIRRGSPIGRWPRNWRRGGFSCTWERCSASPTRLSSWHWP